MLPNLPKKIDSCSVSDGLEILQSFQNQTYKDFSSGLFFSERKIPGLYSRPDDTVFFNLSIAFVLKSILPLLDFSSQQKAKGIIEKTNSLLPQYRNKDNEVSWNFWKTNPSKHFPFGKIAHRFRFFQIPDDIDDSALALMVSEASPEMNFSFHQKIQRYANGSFKTISYLPSQWKTLPVYNTFFIKAMPCGFDFVALCNLMIWQHFSGLEKSGCDKATQLFLNEALLSHLLKDNPALFSPYYPRLALILYHASRLESFVPGFFSAGAIQNLKKLIGETEQQSIGNMDRLMLQSAQLKLKMKPAFEVQLKEEDLDSFVFFVAGLFEEFSSPVIRNFSKLPFTHIHYHCKAMALTLWIEYLVLKENFFKK